MSENKDVLDDLRSYCDGYGIINAGSAHDLMVRAISEIEKLRAAIREVDDVLVVNWVGPPKDGDYRKALHDLVSRAIAEHNDPQISEVAAKRHGELAEARELLKSLEWSVERWDCAFCPICNGNYHCDDTPGPGHGPECRLAAFLRKP